MDRRRFFERIGIALASFAVGASVGHDWLQRLTRRDHAGRAPESQLSYVSEPWEPVVRSMLTQLLNRAENPGKSTLVTGERRKNRIAFPFIENRSCEEIGAFGDLIYRKLELILTGSDCVELVNSRAVRAGFQQAGVRPDDLYTPSARQKFASVMEQQRECIDYYLHASVTDGTFRSNQKYHRDELLTLELMDIETGQTDKESVVK